MKEIRVIPPGPKVKDYMEYVEAKLEIDEIPMEFAEWELSELDLATQSPPEPQTEVKHTPLKTARAIENRMYKLYCDKGSTAVYDLANKLKECEYNSWCKGCEAETPTVKGHCVCLICGQPTIPVTGETVEKFYKSNYTLLEALKEARGVLVEENDTYDGEQMFLLNAIFKIDEAIKQTE